MSLCYVMMPYGGDDPQKQILFEAVYRNIICSAARQAGFSEDQIIREDHSGDAGSITRNIVNNISRADILVADLTGANANVYYEMGIAHVFHKSSTVLIIDKSSKPVFDVQHLNIVEYSTDIIETAHSIQKIAEAITRRLEKKTSSDNPVHEVIASLPEHLVSWIDADDDAMKNRVSELEKKNDYLLKLLQAHGIDPGETIRTQRSPKDLIAEARRALAVSGTVAVDTIRSLAEEKKYEELLDFFEEVISNGRLNNSDATSILRICEETDNIVITECATKILADLFPDDTAFKTKLAKILAAQPGKKEEAIALVNSALGLEKDESGEYCAVDIKTLSHNNIARFLDTYLRIGLYDELIKVCYYLLDNGAQLEKDMLIRNIFTAMSRGFRLEEADAILDQVEEIGTAIAYYTIAAHYDRKGDRLKAYEYYERAMIADPADLDYPRILAAHILDENVSRKDGVVQFVPQKEARKAAGAFLLYLVQIAVQRKEINAVQSVLNILGRSQNGMTQYRSAVVAYAHGERDSLPFEDFDLEPLQYCLSQMSAAED